MKQKKKIKEGVKGKMKAQRIRKNEWSDFEKDGTKKEQEREKEIREKSKMRIWR